MVADNDSYFFGRLEDRQLERRNVHFWRALVDLAAIDGVPDGGTILDVGCHTGGLLKSAHLRWRASKLFGIEPLATARLEAERRLAITGAEVIIRDVDGWEELRSDSIDLVLGHEVLQYVEYLPDLLAEVRRVLGPGRFAYFVVGCHTDNPLWAAWKSEFENAGQVAYDHSPLDIMAAGVEATMLASVRPLLTSAWIHHDPSASSPFPFPSMGTLLDHHFRHKLLFRFERHR